MWLNSVAIFPSLDALDELKVQTGIYAAEFGRSLGGVVSLQTKSGGNAFHGSAFEFARDDVLDANDWFNNRAGRPRPDFSQHQYGATLGGPLARNRTFFFGDYQGWRIKQDLTLVSTVPTDAMRRGDFSELTRPIYDPETRSPFPGNVIPADRIDTVSARIIEQLYPVANTTGRRAANGQIIDNYVINPTQRRHDEQFDVRLDHAITAANRAFVRYSLQNAHRVIPPALPNGDGSGTAGTYEIEAQSVAANDTHMLGSRWLNEIRVGWSGIDIGVARFGSGENTAEMLGIPGINLDARTGGMVSMQFATQDMRPVGAGGTTTANTSAFQVSDSVTHMRGPHTLKAGGSWILRKRFVYFSDNPLGLFGHNLNVTSSCAGMTPACRPDPNSGFSFAGFVLGAPVVFNRSLIEAPYTERRPEWSAYAQDDFRPNARLTLNLGVRWDLFVPYVEDDDRQSNFDTSTGQFVVAGRDATLNGVTVGRFLQTYSKTDFAPRLGFAYDVSGSGRTIVRGGFGMFWNTPLTGTASSKGQNPPFVLAQALMNPSPFVPTLDYAAGSVPPTPVSGGNSRSSFDPDFRDGYAQQWSLNVQQQLGTNSMIEVGYVGSRARQLVVLVDVNQAAAELGVTNPNVNRPFFRVNPESGLGRAVAEPGHARLSRAPGACRPAFFGLVVRDGLVHVRKGDRPLLRHRRFHDVSELLRLELQPGSGKLRRDAGAHVHLDLRAAVRTRSTLRKLADQRSAPGAIRVPLHRVSESESAVDTDGRRPRANLSARPDRIGRGRHADRGSLVRHQRLCHDDGTDRHVRQRRAQYPARSGPVHDRCRARKADDHRRPGNRASDRGVQSAESSRVCQSRQYHRGRWRRHDHEPAAVHADASDPARREGKILTSDAKGTALRVGRPMPDPRVRPTPSGLPPSALVQAELQRILASEIFTRSDRLSAFLTFIVERTLAGHGDSLKEQVIAVELYGKGTDFNTAADPIVRVDARRLRDRLREYYASAQPDGLVISVPKGSYTPTFHTSVAPAGAAALGSHAEDAAAPDGAEAVPRPGEARRGVSSRWVIAATVLVLFVAASWLAIRQLTGGVIRADASVDRHRAPRHRGRPGLVSRRQLRRVFLEQPDIGEP